jgi:hypothetical protein
MSLAIFAAPYENDNDFNNSSINQKKSHNKTQKRYDNYNSNNTYNRANGIGYSNLETTSSKVKNVLQLIHNNMIDSDDDSGLGDFNPPEKPVSAGVERTIATEQMQNRISDANIASMNVYKKTASSTDNYSPGTHDSGQAQPQFVDESDASFDINSLKTNYGDKQSAEEFYKKYVPNYLNSNTMYSNNSSPEEHRYNNQVTKTQTSLASSPGGISPINETILKKLNYMIHLLEESHDEKTGHVTEEVILYCFLGIFIIFIVDSFVKVGKYSR